MFETIVFIAALLGGSPPPLLEKPVDQKQLKCLTEAVYYEAGIESFEGKKYVAEVIMNRVNDDSNLFPQDICSVVNQPSRIKSRPRACQFSYTCSKARKETPDEENYMYSHIAALSVLTNGTTLTNSTHYTQCSVKRKWMKNLKFQIRIGKHCFYG